MLPPTLTLEEFNGREKIAQPPRSLCYEGSPGSDPEDGDLIYFMPWGNLEGPVRVEIADRLSHSL